MEQDEVLTEQEPSLAVVDRDYRGHELETTRVLISGIPKGLPPALVKLVRRRIAIEPEIRHMISDVHLARCPLKGTIGEGILAVICGCGHNIREILAHLRALITTILGIVLAALSTGSRWPALEARA